MPEIARIQRAALEMQHPVVLGNQMQVTSRAGNARQFGDHAIGVRNGVHYVTAYGEIKAAIRRFQLKDALVLEGQAGRQLRVTRPRQRKVIVDDVDAQHAGPGKKLRQPRRTFAGTAAGIEDASLVRQSIAANQLHFLRPNRARLRIQAAHHRLVGHLPGLRIQISHGVSIAGDE
jgi:hypothetical protein